MNALLRLSNDKASLLRLGALGLGLYLALFAIVSLQLGGSDGTPSGNATLGVIGWSKALEPSLAGNTLEQIRNGTEPAQGDLRTIVLPQVIERQTLVVPAGGGGQKAVPAAAPAPLPSSRGADNGPQAPTAHITEVSPSQPRVGRATQLHFLGGDLDGIVRAIAVDWGDGKTDWSYLPDRCTSTTSEPEHSFPSAEHTYEQIGSYQITVSVFSAGSCERRAIQFGTDHVDVEVGAYLPAMPNVAP